MSCDLRHGPAKPDKKVAWLWTQQMNVVWGKSEGKSIKYSIVKTFPTQNNLPWFKYCIYVLLPSNLLSFSTIPL